jgi:hypothetical protein
MGLKKMVRCCFCAPRFASGKTGLEVGKYAKSGGNPQLTFSMVRRLLNQEQRNVLIHKEKPWHPGRERFGTYLANR